MTTLIIISNSDHVINSPAVYVVRDGKHTGTSVTLGTDQTEERALQVAEAMKDAYTKGAEIVNLYNYRQTSRQYSDYIAALTEYYQTWEEHPRYNEAAPELMSKCAEIKRQMKCVTTT